MESNMTAAFVVVWLLKESWAEGAANDGALFALHSPVRHTAQCEAQGVGKWAEFFSLFLYKQFEIYGYFLSCIPLISC